MSIDFDLPENLRVIEIEQGEFTTIGGELHMGGWYYIICDGDPQGPFDDSDEAFDAGRDELRDMHEMQAQKYS